MDTVTAAVLADVAFEAVGEAIQFSTQRYRERIEQICPNRRDTPARKEPDRFISHTDYRRDRANRFRDLASRAEAAEDGWYLLLEAAEADLEVYVTGHAALGDAGSYSNSPSSCRAAVHRASPANIMIVGGWAGSSCVGRPGAVRAGASLECDGNAKIRC